MGSGPDSHNGQYMFPCLGSGRTRALAARRARDEYVERLSGFYRGHEPQVFGSYEELGDTAIHPNASLLISGAQYRRRALVAGTWSAVPHPFDERAKTSWTPLVSQRDGRCRYLPTQLIYYGYPVRGKSDFGTADSNGAAAGRTFADAALRGLLEVVERDSVALWWYNRARRPRVRLEDATDPYIRRLREWFRALDRELWVIDATSDIGIPVIVAVSRRIGAAREHILMGFGAHVDRESAVKRALGELCQDLAVATAAQRHKIRLPRADEWWQRHARVSDARYLQPSRDREIPLMRPSRKGITAAVAFRDCCRTLERHGFEVLVADLTRAELDRQVVKVVVPGLRPWWARFAPGRMYDAPVRAGWRRRPIKESALNPISIWF